MLRAPWNAAVLDELGAFLLGPPMTRSTHVGPRFLAPGHAHGLDRYSLSICT
jgi:hypothetical protein